ncbi:MAG: DUF512 domain-containing protein [Armatimonadota bacterium]|nr:DUF512 domain-containing protein [Armatimonadota bacterium]
MGGIVSSIEPGSIAESLGWLPGDEIISINGRKLRDVIDYEFYSTESRLHVVIRRGGQIQEYDVRKGPYAPLGVEFEDPLFDGIRTCGAHCLFCFVDQLPKGLRKSLYLKDDDYRLSFLDGNFTTLANATEEDISRIIEQKLSPLYVSVHATDHALRQSILGRPCPDILEQLRILAAGKITVHAQIVLCRGINDEIHLEKTVRDLASLFPAVSSIAIVPAAVTPRCKNMDLIGSIDREYSERLLDTIALWQREFLTSLGTRLVWAADEFFMSAGRAVPGRSTYEGFPQISNGVGLVRLFKDSAVHAERKLQHLAERGWRWNFRCSVVTGTLAAPLVEHWSDAAGRLGLNIKVHPIRNTLFGESVTVAGLVPGRDVIEQLPKDELGDLIVLPNVALRDDVFLDDVTLADIEAEFRVKTLCVEPLPHLMIKELIKHVRGED